MNVKKLLCLALSLSLLPVYAQRGPGGKGGGPRPEQLSTMDQPIGASGIAWYTTWKTALAEAKRSNRPIFFFAAAAQCGSTPGVFWPGYTNTQNSLFTQKNFIAASRKFVCVRLETYESAETQKMIRNFLNGKLANTAFVMLAPDGKTELSSSGRSPNQSLSRRSRDAQDGSSTLVIAAMEKASAQYPAKVNLAAPTIQDFDSFAQALRVASADQRLLVNITANSSDKEKLQQSLRPLFGHESTIGRYHWNFTDAKTDVHWNKNIKDATPSPSIAIIQAGKYGLKGTALATLPLNSTLTEIATALKKANSTFSKNEKRKNYSEHVKDGRRDQVNFSNNIEYGEDRDGDGKIDPKPSRR